MSLLRFVVVPLLKVLLNLVLLHFREAFKVSMFAKSLVDLSSDFHTTEPLYMQSYLSPTLCSSVLPQVINPRGRLPYKEEGCNNNVNLGLSRLSQLLYFCSFSPLMSPYWLYKPFQAKYKHLETIDA